LDWRPESCVFWIAAKFFKSVAAIGAHENVDAPIRRKRLDAVDNDPRFVNSLRHSVSRRLPLVASNVVKLTCSEIVLQPSSPSLARVKRNLGFTNEAPRFLKG
jgi:hypothetical protein